METDDSDYSQFLTTDMFCVTQHQETKAVDNMLLNKFNVLEYVLTIYILTNEVQVIEGKIVKKIT